MCSMFFISFPESQLGKFLCSHSPESRCLCGIFLNSIWPESQFEDFCVHMHDSRATLDSEYVFAQPGGQTCYLKFWDWILDRFVVSAPVLSYF